MALLLGLCGLLALAGCVESQSTIPIHVSLQDGVYSNFIDAFVGTPAQNQNLTLDFFTTDTYLVDVNADSSCSKSQLFDYTKSSSFSIVKNYTSAYDNKTLVQDIIGVGKTKTSKSLRFNVSDTYGDDWDCTYSGVVGLGVEPQRKDTFVSQVLSNFPKQVATISPDTKSTTDEKIPQLSLTLGGSDDAVCGTKWETAECSGKFEFTYPGCTFPVNGYAFDTYVYKRTSTVAQCALSLQRNIYLPSSIYDRALRFLDYDEASGGISCNGNHGDLSIYINDSKFTLPGHFYVGKEVGNGYCELLLINGVTMGLSEDLLVMPLGFFANNCQQIDFAKGTMSLTAAK